MLTTDESRGAAHHYYGGEVRKHLSAAGLGDRLDLQIVAMGAEQRH